MQNLCLYSHPPFPLIIRHWFLHLGLILISDYILDPVKLSIYMLTPSLKRIGLGLVVKSLEDQTHSCRRVLKLYLGVLE